MVRFEGQADFLLAIVEGECEIELGVGVYSVGGRLDEGIVDESNVIQGIPP